LSGQKTRKLTGLAALGANQTDIFDRTGGRMFKKSSGTFSGTIFGSAKITQ
jgi:hypothetical protein